MLIPLNEFSVCFAGNGDTWDPDETTHCDTLKKGLEKNFVLYSQRGVFSEIQGDDNHSVTRDLDFQTPRLLILLLSFLSALAQSIHGVTCLIYLVYIFVCLLLALKYVPGACYDSTVNCTADLRHGEMRKDDVKMLFHDDVPKKVVKNYKIIVMVKEYMVP